MLVPSGSRAGRRMRSCNGGGIGAASTTLRPFSPSFLAHGAAQCGACTPGMLVAATALLDNNRAPSEAEVMDAIGGVLCRCTGYRKIVNAILGARSEIAVACSPEAGAAVGQRLVRLDGKKKVDGTDIFGADETPAGALGLRVIRSPHHRTRFQFGDLDAFVR